MPFLKIFGRPMLVLQLNVPFVMSPSPLPWRKYLDGLFHHIGQTQGMEELKWMPSYYVKWVNY